ncbi:hypothetical protein FDZ73_24475, partial [bacterium]
MKDEVRMNRNTLRVLILMFLEIVILTACAGPAQPTIQPTEPVLPTEPSGTNAAPVEAKWWQKAVFYEVFVRSFFDSNGDG